MSKLYFVDYDDDGSEDIIVWRKLYRSRENNDPVAGFELLRGSLVLYKFTEGSYVKQATDENEISIWMQDQELTWSRGYPSSSECVGEEGQLIPEMHDPLLNDPDVLR